MSAVLYYEDSAKIIKRYKTMAAAKGALTRATNSGKMRILTSFGYGLIREKDIARLAVCTAEYFATKVDYEVEVCSLMSEPDENGKRKMVKILRSEEGSCVDPSTERYWSM